MNKADLLYHPDSWGFCCGFVFVFATNTVSSSGVNFAATHTDHARQISNNNLLLNAYAVVLSVPLLSPLVLL